MRSCEKKTGLPKLLKSGILNVMNNIVKSCLKIIPVYFVLMALCLFAATFLYMFYTMCSTIVAGSRISHFTFLHFMHGIILSFPIVLLFAGPFTSFYIIRHRELSLWCLVPFLLVHCALFAFAQPAFLSSVYDQQEKLAPEENIIPPSPGYFRTLGGKYIVYYSSMTDVGVASGILIDTEKATDNLYTFHNTKINTNNEFADSLIFSSIKLPIVINKAIKSFKAWHIVLYNAIMGKKSQWLSFCSVLLPLVAGCLMVKISRWRLVSLIMVMGATILIYVFNLSVLAGGFLAEPFYNANFALTFMDHKCNPLLVLCNAGFLLILGLLTIFFTLRTIKIDEDFADDDSFQTEGRE